MLTKTYKNEVQVVGIENWASGFKQEKNTKAAEKVQEGKITKTAQDSIKYSVLLRWYKRSRTFK